MITAKVEFYEDAAGEHRWRLRALNGKIIAASGEGFTRERDAIRSFANVKNSMYEAWEAFLSGDDDLEVVES